MSLRHHISMLANDARVTSGSYSAQVRREIARLFHNRHKGG